MIQQVYSGPFLSIQFDQINSIFIQSWSKIETLTTVSFKNEMLMYVQEYKLHRPKNSLWLQEGFTLVLGNDDFLWIEKYVNIPCFEYGNKKLAFVIGKKIEEDASVINSFEETQSCIIPRYFALEKIAREWLNEKDIKDPKVESEPFEFRMVNHDEGKTTFEIVSPTHNLKQTMLHLNHILEKERFRKTQVDSFENLTKSERNILRLLGQNKSTSDISEDSSTSIHTVRNHIRNLKVKLDIGRESELVSFAKMYF